MWLTAVNLSFKWGILGASKFAFEQMAPAIHAAKSNSLVALATKDSKKAKKFLALSDTLNIYYDYNDLLEDPKLIIETLKDKNLLEELRVEAYKNLLASKSSWEDRTDETIKAIRIE